jgi:lysophospholipase
MYYGGKFMKSVISIVFVVVFSFSCSLFAISEKNFNEDYAKLVEPFVEKHAQDGHFQGTGDVRVNYRKFIHPKAKGVIVFLPGRTESYIKYGELFYDLYSKGYSIYCIDYRGQGFSERFTKNPQIGHVDSYDDYVKDLRIFLKEVVMKTPHNKLYGLGHSMGSNILALFSTMYPNTFDRIVWSSPMLDIDTPPFPAIFVYYLTKVLKFFGLEKSYVLGGKDYDPNEKNKVSHSAARYKKATENRLKYPEAIIAAPSFRWVGASLESNWRIRKTTYKITVPILMLQSGVDLVVLTEGQNVICRQAIRCRKIVFPNAYHEIFGEVDIIRDRALEEILKFYDAGLKEKRI